MKQSYKNVVFFDGVCGLCNLSVDILLKLNKKKRLKFAPIQGVSAKQFKIPFDDIAEAEQSIVFADDQEKIHFRSDAAIKILNALIGFPLFSFLFFVPRFFRDGVYKFIARNRYAIFGKRETCRLPDPNEEDQFLD